jgi:hypothetical protein
MIMKYKMIGTPKLEKDIPSCPTCKNGAIFEKEPHIRTDEFGCFTDEPHCGVCNTKYKFDRVDADILRGAEFDGYPVIIMGDLILSEECIPNKIEESIRKELKAEVTDMIEGEHIHNWKASEPFKTAEGKFQLDFCTHCRTAKINYRGVEYKDNILKIVNFIAHNGIQKEKEQKIVLNTYRDMLVPVTLTSALPSKMETSMDFEDDNIKTTSDFSMDFE